MSIAVKMALAGHGLSRTEFVSRKAPYCDDPVTINRRTHPCDPCPTIEVSFLAPCRKCAKCLQFRQMKWGERAQAELLFAHSRNRRSWWITLTFSPVHLAGIYAEASRMKGDTPDKRLDAAAFKHVQLYCKRLRKEKARFRYLCVFEKGEETGRAHYHMLMHEIGPRPVTSRMIEGQWRSNVHTRLVDMDRKGLASYLTKYATKSKDIRPRASQHYGDPGAVLS